MGKRIVLLCTLLLGAVASTESLHAEQVSAACPAAKKPDASATAGQYAEKPDTEQLRAALPATEEPAVRASETVSMDNAARKEAPANHTPPPRYVYAQLIAANLPRLRPYAVAFDYGQPLPGAWSYDFLKDGEGNELKFSSGIAALNYLTERGWEFVQAHTSGEENDKCHYILRIAADSLPEPLRRALLAPPGVKPEKERMK